MDTARHRSIQRLVVPQPGISVADVSISLWVGLAAELGLLIGDGGFVPLYVRSVHLSVASFPWLRPISDAAPLPSGNSRFSELKRSLDGREPGEASQASAALLNTFIDMLAGLIGETLTIGILRSAWANTPFASVDKEFSS